MLKTLDSIRTHWRHYGVVALVTAGCFASCYHTVRREAIRQDRIGSSLLHLAGRHVQVLPNGSSSQGSVTPEQLGRVDSPILDGGRQGQPYIPEEGLIKIIPLDPTKPLNVRIRYQKLGLCFLPGLQGTFAPLGVGLDIKWAFAYRFGSVVGLNYFELGSQHDLSPTAGITYHISKDWFRNTDLVVGYAPLSFLPIYGGFRVSF